MKSFITYTQYSPFVMGGKVNQRVKVEVEVVHIMTFKGINLFIAKTEGVYTVHEYSTGQGLGYPHCDFESCKNGALYILSTHDIKDLKKEMAKLPFVEDVLNIGLIERWLVPILEELSGKAREKFLVDMRLWEKQNT